MTVLCRKLFHNHCVVGFRSADVIRAPGNKDMLGLSMEIDEVKSPELAIEWAYEYASALRGVHAPAQDFDSELDAFLDEHKGANSVLPYVRAAFIAGYQGKPLAWFKPVQRETRQSEIVLRQPDNPRPYRALRKLTALAHAN